MLDLDVKEPLGFFAERNVAASRTPSLAAGRRKGVPGRGVGGGAEQVPARLPHDGRAEVPVVTADLPGPLPTHAALSPR